MSSVAKMACLRSRNVTHCRDLVLIVEKEVVILHQARMRKI